MKFNPQNYVSFESWFQLWNALCGFAYEAGREAFNDGLSQEMILESKLDDCFMYIAWEYGWHNEQNRAN